MATISPHAWGDVTGTVTFKEGNTVLGTASISGDPGHFNEAYFAAKGLTVGDHQITAEYSGNGSYGPSTTSSAITQTVATDVAPTTARPTVTTVETYNNPSMYGVPVYISIKTETNPRTSGEISGAVVLMDGDTELATLAMEPQGISNGYARASFNATNLAPGDHPLTAKYYGDRRNGTVNSVSEVYVHTVLGNGGQTTGTVTGRVYGEVTGWVYGATVKIGQKSTTTNAEGAFTLSNVPSGTQTVTASAYGYVDSYKSVSVPSGQSYNAGTITLYVYGEQPPKKKHSSSESAPSPVPTDPEDTKTEDGSKALEPAPTTVGSDEYQDPNDIFRSRVVNSDSNVITGVEARTAQILSKGGNLVALKYNDVDRHWSLPSVEKLTKLGVLNGYPDGGFEPDDQITRAEFAAMIDRAFVGMASRKVTFKEEDFAAFSDINGHWSTNNLKKLVAVGVLTGYEDGTIRPEQTISRQEMALMITRVLNAYILKKDTSKVQFTDLDGAYGTEAIKKTTALGIFDGTSDHTFAPNSGATRAEAIETIIKTYSLSPSIKKALESLK
ncbi:S-layer homology domain-containing protein [Paenibacillus hexagrammi]|uniref:S-layer homology domain-containing protein n=1 Tax=Paenibacillus hexagrammi TaxID=2908839 RepID=A0ABY3SIG3_9BACL|nr:S-layer homology domain-containing protein [Paenibacillus sp. YPD9-1]UJF33803.1 S-layer homology domain-containing protein [Paenibacillus sp. YPD9-1]